MSELHSWVPDGDPCPRHSKEISRLVHVQGSRFHSQCQRCIDNFFTWRWANMNQKAETLPDPKGPQAEQHELLGESE